MNYEKCSECKLTSSNSFFCQTNSQKPKSPNLQSEMSKKSGTSKCLTFKNETINLLPKWLAINFPLIYFFTNCILILQHSAYITFEWSGGLKKIFILFILYFMLYFI